MDGSLFSKHIKQFKKQKEDKDEVILIGERTTGIVLDEKDIAISKKEVKINTTSTIKHKLFQKKVSEKLKEGGYIFKV